MPIFVTDSTVLLPGLLDPESYERRLLVLCAYSRLMWYHRFAAREVATSTEVQGGGLVAGPGQELREAAARRAYAVAERLPDNARQDALLALSTPILDGLERTLRSERVGAGLGMTADVAGSQRRLAANLATFGPVVSPTNLRRVSPHPGVNALVDTARQARAEFLVSASPDVSPLYGDVEHEDIGFVTRVCPFDSFLRYSELEEGLDGVDGSILRFAVAVGE